MNNNLRSSLLFIALVIIWGSAFILIKKSLYYFSPQHIASMRIFVAFLFLLPFCFSRFKKRTPKAWFYIVLSGIIGSYLPAYLFAHAQQEVNSMTAGILTALSPVFTVGISCAFFGDRLNGYKLIGLLVGLLGAWGLIATRSEQSFEFVGLGGWLIVIATMCYGLNLNFLKYKLEDIPSFDIACLSLCVVGCVAGVHLFAFSDFITVVATQAPDFTGLLYVILLGLSATGLGLILFNRLLKTASPIFASSITYAMPVVSLFWGVLDGEWLNAMQWIAVSMVMLSVVLIRK